MDETPELTLDAAVDALMPVETPRDEQGRFTKAEAPAEGETEEPVAEEATNEAETEQAEPAEEEELSWDQVKDVKLKVPMKADGKEWTEELTLEELRAQRMMQADYQRKTQEISQQRAQAEEQARQAVREAQSKYAQELQALEAMVDSLTAPHLQNVDFNQLSREDPATWAQLFQQKQQIDQAKQAVKTKFQQLQEQSRAELLREGMSKLTDPASPFYVESLEAKVPQLQEVASKYFHLSRQEVASIVDPRFVKGLAQLAELEAEAKQWRDLQTKKPEIEKRVTSAPKALKPNRPDPKATQNAAKQALKARINSGGASINDAVNYLMG